MIKFINPLKYFIFFYLISILSLAQSKVNEQITLSIENDKVVFTDKDYTSGLFINYKRLLNNDVLFFKVEESQIQLEFLLGNETYTPTNLWSTNVNKFDRPYSGWSFLTTKLKQIKSNQSHAFALEIGVTGKQSGSGELQKWWHEAINVKVPVWTQEIENKVLVTIKSSHVFNFNLTENQALHYKVQPALGLKDIYIENSVSYYIGKLNPFKTSSRSGAIDQTLTKEFYAVLGLGYKFVAHNTLIQGDLNYNDATFTIQITNNIFKVHSGLVYKTKRHLWQFLLNYNTKETPKSISHIYGRFTYGFLF